MRKHFVLDVGTLISKRDVPQSFGTDNNIYIPFWVMQELEKRYSERIDERGKIAREVLSYVGSFHIHELEKGVRQKNGSILKVVTKLENHGNQTTGNEDLLLKGSELDEKIIKTCLQIQGDLQGAEPVILVSKSATLRKKAELAKIEAQTFKDELLPEISEQYTGRKVIEVDDYLIKEFRINKKIPVIMVVRKENMKDIFQNMFIVLKGKSVGLEYGRVYKENIIPLTFEAYYPSRVIPKNEGQRFVIEALMMDYKMAPLVIIKGPAGTGKTFLSLAAGLEHLEKGEFPKNILISRAPVETGEKLGYLPGDEQEKMGPYVRGIKDNLEELINMRENETNNPSKNAHKPKRKVWNHSANHQGDEDEKPQTEDGTIFFENGLIKLEAINYIRGRNITKTYIIIDEVQNLTPVEVKTIITRVSDGTKLILMGDPAQIDRPELDERNNGLSYAAERMKGDPTCWQITMTDEESVRSELAKRASMLL